MFRDFALLFLVWTVLLGPALCVGGLMEHACDCEGVVEVDCEHEDACATDPCAPLLRVGDHDEATNHELEVQQVVFAVHAWELVVDAGRWSWPARPPAPPDWSSLPYAQSDRPLLI